MKKHCIPRPDEKIVETNSYKTLDGELFLDWEAAVSHQLWLDLETWWDSSMERGDAISTLADIEDLKDWFFDNREQVDMMLRLIDHETA